jgi:hypothetical protein
MNSAYILYVYQLIGVVGNVKVQVQVLRSTGYMLYAYANM